MQCHQDIDQSPVSRSFVLIIKASLLHGLPILKEAGYLHKRIARKNENSVHLVAEGHPERPGTAVRILRVRGSEQIPGCEQSRLGLRILTK